MRNGQGRAIAAVGRPPLFPFGPLASVFLEIDAEQVYRAHPRGEVESVDTIGAEVWGRVDCERGERFEGAANALALYRAALASYLVGAGDALVRAAAEHASTRKQFGQPIGQFQAVSHPLADVHMRIEAARLIARSAADQLEGGDLGASLEACAAHYSARRAATEAAHTCHQIFGALGITLEGPAFHLSRRILQLAALAPGAEASAEALYSGIRKSSGSHSSGPIHETAHDQRGDA